MKLDHLVDLILGELDSSKVKASCWLPVGNSVLGGWGGPQAGLEQITQFVVHQDLKI